MLWFLPVTSSWEYPVTALEGRVYIFDDAFAVRDQDRYRPSARPRRKACAMIARPPACCCCVECKLSAQRMVRTRLAPVELRSLHAVIGAGLDDFSNRFLIGMLGQQDEGRGPRVCRNSERSLVAAASPVSCSNKTSHNRPLQHGLCLFQSSAHDRVPPAKHRGFARESPGQKKILLLAPHQQDAQKRLPEFGLQLDTTDLFDTLFSHRKVSIVGLSLKPTYNPCHLHEESHCGKCFVFGNGSLRRVPVGD